MAETKTACAIAAFVIVIVILYVCYNKEEGYWGRRGWGRGWGGPWRRWGFGGPYYTGAYYPYPRYSTLYYPNQVYMY